MKDSVLHDYDGRRGEYQADGLLNNRKDDELSLHTDRRFHGPGPMSVLPPQSATHQRPINASAEIYFRRIRTD